MIAMYCMYIKEERRRSGQNGTRPYGLRSQMAPYRVARRSFGFTKLYSSRLVWSHLGQQRSDQTDISRPSLARRFKVRLSSNHPLNCSLNRLKVRLVGSALVAAEDRKPAGAIFRDENRARKV